ncbi:MAG: Bifunctional protein HldE [Candidatus Anoxychlamydiales bacterium]|nr:Bifunctional protein HldE [Candidatus Anoxychlamydiales bacterium]
MWEKEYKKKVIEPKELEKKIKALKKEQKSIVTLNGSFDLLHAGHLKIIYEASTLADVLIVALNSDLSIKEYKSPYRPIITLEYRMQMISALFFVDYVTYFNEVNPIKVLEIIKPNIHVNGSEYGENCIEKNIVEKNGGIIHIVNKKPSLSTTNIIEKIKCE